MKETDRSLLFSTLRSIASDETMEINGFFYSDDWFRVIRSGRFIPDEQIAIVEVFTDNEPFKKCVQSALDLHDRGNVSIEGLVILSDDIDRWFVGSEDQAVMLRMIFGMILSSED